MKMLGEGIKTLPKKEREIPKRCYPIQSSQRTGPPDHKKLRRQRNNSVEQEDPAHQNKKAKGAEMQPFKAETDNPRPIAGEDTM